MGQMDARYERNPEFIFRKIVDELVLVPIHQDVADMDCIYTMNAMGAFIWEKLETPTRLGDLHGSIVEQYAVDAEEAADDLVQFVQELESAGAVRRV